MSTEWMAYAVLVLAGIAAIWFGSRAAITVCVIQIANGTVRVTRGGVAPRVLVDLGDVVRKPPVARATIRITRDRGRAAVALSGTLSTAQEQQVRNVIGSLPLAALANARRKR